MILTMKSSFSGPVIVLLLLSSNDSGLGSVVSKSFSYIQGHFNWNDAQSYCQRYHTDLATIYTPSDEDRMTMTQYHAWIGLAKSSSSNTWYWSDGDSYSGSWAQNEPHNSESCASVYFTNKKFYGVHCEASFFFFCHDEQFEYHFIPQSKSRAEAREYCQTVYDDLANVKDTEDRNLAVVEQDFPVWIGLHRDVSMDYTLCTEHIGGTMEDAIITLETGGTWRWGTGLSEYNNWALDEPRATGDCVSISSSTKKMATQKCSDKFPFVCFRDNLVLVKENKTWEEALEHCRSLKPSYYSSIRYDLVSVQPGQDHDYLINKAMEADTEEVWAGLRFLGDHWLWVNGASMAYSDLPLCPPMGQRCGILAKNDTGSMKIIDCTERRNFLCYSSY